MSSGVRFKSITCKALSSMFVDLRFARSTALRPRSHATSGPTVNRCIWRLKGQSLDIRSTAYWLHVYKKLFQFKYRKTFKKHKNV